MPIANEIKTDSFLWYNVGGWKDYGLAIPNFGNDGRSKNETIRDLVETMGRNLAGIMWSDDANLRTPPSINVITAAHQLCTRCRSILSSRAVPPGKNLLIPDHTNPPVEDFIIFPVPYFKVRNPWLKRYCGLALIALSEAIQHTENARVMEVTTVFADKIGQYIQRIYQLMSIELLRVEQPEVGEDGKYPINHPKSPNFTLTDAQIRAYDPAKWFTSTEMIDVVPSFDLRPTEDQLQPLTDGVASSMVPKLGTWPTNNAAIVSPSSGSSSETFTPGTPG